MIMTMAGYTKLFNSILASTVWREDNTTRIVWITLLAMADKHGVAEGSVPGLADFARVPVEGCREALVKLSAPDPDSRSQEHEGRRIAAVDGGWQLLNHAKYRSKLSADERREYNRVKKAEERARTSASVKHVNDTSALSAHTEAEAEAEAEADTEADTEAVSSVTTRFALWWGAYPKKKSRATAFKAFWKLNPDAALVARMLDALKWQVTQPSWVKDGGQFIPYPASYLNAAGYDDAPDAPVKAGSSSVTAFSSKGGARDTAAVDEALRTRQRRQEMVESGMDTEAVEAVFEREYEERKANR